VEISDLEYGEEGTASTPISFVVSPECPNNYYLLMELNMNYSDSFITKPIGITISAPELQLEKVRFTDDNNNQLESGEEGNMHILLKKMSYLNVNNLNLDVNFTNPDIQLGNLPLEVAEINEELYEIIIPVNVMETVENGNYYEYVITCSYDNSSFEKELSYCIGNYRVLMQEDFSGNLTNWAVFSGIMDDNNYAGGSGNEGLLQASTMTSVFAQTKNLDKRDAQKYIIKFRYRAFNGSDYYGLYAEDNQMVWIDYENMQEADYIELEYSPQNSNDEMAFTWAMSQTNNQQYFAFDDIEIASVTHNPGAISGTVTLNGGDGDVTQVAITDGFTTVYPDENGFYTMNVYAGNLTISAELSGYVLYESDSFSVTPSCQIENSFEMEYLIPPTNLTYEFFPETNIIRLSWDFSNSRYEYSMSREDLNELEKEREIEITNIQQQNKSRTEISKKVIEREAQFSHFRVYLILNNSTTISYNTTNNEYSRILFSQGNYQFYVVAIYQPSYMSNPSNTVIYDHVDSEDINAPIYEFSLSQNYPNPFSLSSDRSSGTAINYTIPNDGQVELSVYNLKGELVKTLLNEKRSKGPNSTLWNGLNDNNKIVGNGIYFYRLKFENKTIAVKKCILIK
ncbi:MAG: T9SS type A sorting domain-containing protein, partial [Candidatus Cloacimonetes bacterium]|nr:T9SS type A sorting domain-containing protein [Candidatus Cloacimonadota bacterium]